MVTCHDSTHCSTVLQFIIGCLDMEWYMGMLHITRTKELHISLGTLFVTCALTRCSNGRPGPRPWLSFTRQRQGVIEMMYTVRTHPMTGLVRLQDLRCADKAAANIHPKLQ